MRVDSSSLDPVPVTTRFLKAHVDYTYLLEEQISVEVEENPYDDFVDDGNNGLLGNPEVCCKIYTYTGQGRPSTVSYKWLQSDQCPHSNSFTRGSPTTPDYCEKECCKTGDSGYILVLDIDECNQKSPGTTNTILSSSQKELCET